MPVTDGVKTATSGHVIQYQMTFKKKKMRQKKMLFNLFAISWLSVFQMLSEKQLVIH